MNEDQLREDFEHYLVTNKQIGHKNHLRRRGSDSAYSGLYRKNYVQMLWQAWLAAKAKYEPKRMPIPEFKGGAD